ncbi:head GIN domain-containing protein [Bacteroidota bacterium]
MKNKILISFPFLVLILVSTLAFSQNGEVRDVSDFTTISLGIHAELYLTQGSPQKLVIEASEDQLGNIETVVKEGHLRIKSDRSITRFKDVKIWITVPTVEAIALSGSGKIMAETAINSEELDLKISGSGKLNIDELQAEELGAAISGSGNLYLSGSAEEAEIRISGSGSVFASGLKVAECGVKISGSGSCEVDATGELNAAISGSGRVTYFSNPQIDAAVSGSGRVKKGEK